MSDPIDFDRERQRRKPSRPPQHWMGRAVIVAAAVYAVVRAWQMWGQPLP